MGRFILSKTHDWELVHDDQDIRGWPVKDHSGSKIGSVAELIANSDNELVESIVLDNGTEYPARDVDLGDGVVMLKSEAAAGTDADPVVRAYDNTRVRTRTIGRSDEYKEHTDAYRDHYDATYASAGEPYETYEPAYQWGHDYGLHKDYADRDYDAMEPEMRRRYEREHGENTWERVKDAVKHAFDHSRSHSHQHHAHA